MEYRKVSDWSRGQLCILVNETLRITDVFSSLTRQAFYKTRTTIQIINKQHTKLETIQDSIQELRYGRSSYEQLNKPNKKESTTAPQRMDMDIVKYNRPIRSFESQLFSGENWGLPGLSGCLSWYWTEYKLNYNLMVRIRLPGYRTLQFRLSLYYSNLYLWVDQVCDHNQGVKR